MKDFSLIKFWPWGAIITTLPVPVNCDFCHRFKRNNLMSRCKTEPEASQPGCWCENEFVWVIRCDDNKAAKSQVREVLEMFWRITVFLFSPHNSCFATSTSVSIYASFTDIASNNPHFGTLFAFLIGTSLRSVFNRRWCWKVWTNNDNFTK